MAELLQPALQGDPASEAVAELAKRISQLDVAAVLTHKTDTVTASALPHLADQFHVRHTAAFKRQQNQTVRRGLVNQAIRMHRLKGTLAGMKWAAQSVGASVDKAYTPPGKFYPSAALTREQRNAFLANYPQMRIYRPRDKGQRVGLHVGDTLGQLPPVTSDALVRTQLRAYLWRDGVQTPLTVIERVYQRDERTAETATLTEAALFGNSGWLSFVANHPRYLTYSNAPSRFYRLTLQTAYRDSHDVFRRTTATPGMTPIDLKPDMVAEIGQAAGVHAGQFVAHHLMPSTANDRIYQRLYLFDPDITIHSRHASAFLDAARLGMPAYHAQLSVAVRGHRLKMAAWRYCRGFLLVADKAPLSDCLEALRDMARGADRIAIDTHTQQPATAGESVFAGGVWAGDWITH